MVILRKALPVLACLVLPFIVNSAAAQDTLLNTKSFLKEVVAGNPGLELIVPQIAEIDNNADSYPDKITIKFKVLPVGTTTKLFVTPLKKFIPPAQPCGNPTFVDWDWEPQFFGENNTHTAMAYSFTVECQQQNGTFKEDAGGFLYVADTTQSGSGWAKTWLHKELISADIVDWDDDQQDEIKVVLLVPTAAGAKLKVLFLDKMTGAIESDRSYAAITSFDF